MAGFEAAVGSRRVTFQVQNRHRLQDCCLQCSPSPGRLRRCARGKCLAWVVLLGVPGQEPQNGQGGSVGGYEGLRAPARPPQCLVGLWGWRSQHLLSPPSTFSGALPSRAQPS